MRVGGRGNRVKEKVGVSRKGRRKKNKQDFSLIIMGPECNSEKRASRIF